MLIALGFLKSLLCVIGIAILALIILILLLLFLPFVYRVKAEYEEDMKAEICVRWLFGFFSAVYSVPSEGRHLKVRICGFTIYPRRKRDEDDPLQENPEDPYDITPPEESGHEKIEEEVSGSSAEPEPSKTVEKDFDSSRDYSSDENKKDRKTSGIISKIIRTIDRTFDKIDCMIRSFCDKIKRIILKKNQLIDFFKKESTKAGLTLIWEETKYLLLKMKPDKWLLKLKFGEKDPGVTGEITGYLCTLKPMLREHLALYPDFSNEVFRAYLSMRGGFKLYALIIVLWKLYFSKDLRRLRRDFRAIRNS